MRRPQLGDRVHWNCDPPQLGLSGVVVMVEGTWTMNVRWDNGRTARHLPQRVMAEPRWSYEDERIAV